MERQVTEAPPMEKKRRGKIILITPVYRNDKKYI